MPVDLSLKNLRRLMSDAELVVTGCRAMLIEVAITLERQVEALAATLVRLEEEEPFATDRRELAEVSGALAAVVERLKALDGGDG